MKHGIFAIANIGHLKFYVGDTSKIKERWYPTLAQLDQGIHPNTTLQAVWNQEGGKRRFSFHTIADLENQWGILGIEQFFQDIGQG